MATASSQAAPPIAHAIGGSLGSALALLLFYPLERARIELQSQAANNNNNNTHPQQKNAELESVEVQVELAEEMQPRVVVVGGKEQEEEEEEGGVLSPSPSTPKSETSDSWVPLERSSSSEHAPSSPSWSIHSSTTTYESTQQQQQQQIDSSRTHNNNNQGGKVGLWQCLLRLQERKALYQGVTPVITTIVTSQFVFFYMHAYMKSILLLKQQHTSVLSNNHRQRASLSLIASCLAGVINVICTNPLWVVNMSIVTGQSKSSSLRKELVRMIQTFGLRHMWKGTGASILLVSNPVIQFFCYEQLKVARLAAAAAAAGRATAVAAATTTTTTMLPPVEAFVVGALAKAVATVITYPLQLTQTILRLKDDNDNDNDNDHHHGRYKGSLDCLIQLYQRNGLQEWFTGMKAKLLQTVLTAAFTFLTYEQILGAVQAALVKGGPIPF